MALANPRIAVASFISAAYELVRPAHAEPVAVEEHIVDGYRIVYDQPSEQSINASDPEMDAIIARSKIVSVEGEL